MGEVTPEERVVRIKQWCEEHYRLDDDPSNALEVYLADEIRLAVEAETERASNVSPIAITCPVCSVPDGQRCTNTFATNLDCFHNERWRAAIRKPPEGSDRQGGESDGRG